MKNKWGPLIIILLSTFAASGMAAGFLMGVKTIIQPDSTSSFPIKKEQPRESSAIKQKGTIHIVSLGDSLSRGVGDDSGEGYTQKVKKQLEKETAKEISLSNLSVSGAKTLDLQQLLNTEGIKHSIAKADIILLTIGGNDLFPGVDQLDPAVLQAYQPDVEGFRKRSDQIIQTLTEINPDVQIYWVSLYNPFEDLTELGNTSSFVLKWNHQLELLAASYPALSVIPVFDLFSGRTGDFLYSDHFHPNAAGYQAIAERVLHSIKSRNNLGGDE